MSTRCTDSVMAMLLSTRVDIVSKTSQKPLPNSDAQSNRKLFETSNAKGPHDVQKSSRLTVEICASRMNFIYTLRTQESI